MAVVKLVLRFEQPRADAMCVKSPETQYINDFVSAALVFINIFVYLPSIATVMS